MVWRYNTGETIPITFTVKNVTNLDKVDCLFGLQKMGESDDDKLFIVPEKDGNQIKVVLQPEDTMRVGTYKFEFRVRVDNIVDSVHEAYIVLTDSVIKGGI